MSEQKEAYKTLSNLFKKEYNIQIGSKLKVLRKAKDYEMGWGTVWDKHPMDDMVGQEIIVESYDECFGFLSKKGLDGRWYPFFVLEPSGPIVLPCSADYTAEILSSGNIKVGCQEIPFENLEAIYNTAKTAKDQND